MPPGAADNNSNIDVRCQPPKVDDNPEVQENAESPGRELQETLKRYSVVVVEEEIKLVDKGQFNLVVGVMIMINALFIGIETDLGSDSADPHDRLGWYIIENLFCIIFFIEMCLRFYCNGIVHYFKDPWNILDFCLVCLAVADTWILTFMGGSSNLRMLSVLRVIRMLRLVRLIRLLRMFKELWLIVNGLIESTKTLGWVALLLVLFLYICAIFTTMQVGQNHKIYMPYEADTGWDYRHLFGTVPASMYTLFQILTLESWSDGIARHVILNQPWMAAFFIIFLMFTTFGLLNLVVGVIVENTLSAAKNNEEKIRKHQERERARILEHLKEIFQVADDDGSGGITVDEFRAACSRTDVQEKLKIIDLPVQEAEELFLVLDGDGSGTLTAEEFIGGVMRLKGNAKSKDLLGLQISVGSLGKRLDSLDTQIVSADLSTDSLQTKMKVLLKRNAQLLAHLDGGA